MNGRPPADHPPTRWWRTAGVLWVVAAVILWNGVFDAYVTAGAHDYVERQQRFVAGRGPRVDLDQAMNAARRAGLQAATAWAGAALVPALAVALWFRLGRRPRRGR